jgi:hypothetical protein
MRFRNRIKILTLAILGVLLLPVFLPTSPTVNPHPVMASYNPAPANRFHSPLSSMALIAVTGARPNLQSAASATARSTDPSSLKTIQQNALRFIIDNSYFPQSETTIAVDPANPNHVVGGFNDAKFLTCFVLPADCGTAIPASLSGFTTSTDGGRSVAKSGSIPNLNITGTLLDSWGDPSVAATVDGNFFYASLAINPFSSFDGNGILIAESNPNLFNPNVTCTTPVSNSTSNPCWKSILVYGNVGFPVLNLDDKDRIAVDRNPSSPFYGSVYVGWDHFTEFGESASFLARCDSNLTTCTMLSGAGQPLLSGTDPVIAWTTPITDKNGNVHVAWCNFGTFLTFGPVYCRVNSSPPGGTSFGTPQNILSYMGTGTNLPTDTIVIGWASEQFRVASGLISIAADTSPKSNNLYFTTEVCTSGHYYAISSAILPVPPDNPGDCGQSAVVLSRSTDNGLTWSSPTTLSHPSVNDQPFVTVDSQTGTVYAVYYTTQYDPFNHRIDVVASTSNNAGQTFHQQRVTSVSNEPDSDPNMYNYLVSSGFGGSFTLPQYGDYFEATAMGGTLWVLFTGNYAVEAGTFQADPFLATFNQNGPPPAVP